MSETAQKPTVRFKGFTDPWEQRKLGEVLKYEQPQAYIVQSTKYDDKNEIPVLTAGQSFILGYTDEQFGIKKASEKDPIIIFDDFTTSSHYVDFPFKVKSSAMKLLTLSNPKDNIHCAYNVLKCIKYIPVSHERHWISTFSKFDVLLPKSADEQKQIGQCFSNLDNLITLHQRKYEKLVDVKKALLEKMFPADGENVPQIRFRGFTDPWEQRKLGEAAPLRGGYAFKSEEYVDNGIPIIRISNILSDGTIGADFAHYNRQNDDEIYSLKDGAALLAMSGATTGKVSILNCKNTEKYYQNQRVGYFERKKKFAYEFVSTIVRSSFFAKQLTAVLVAGAQPNVSSKDIDSFEFLFPKDKEEQQKIGHYFRSLDNLITLYQRKLEKLKNIKKALLDKMFV